MLRTISTQKFSWKSTTFFILIGIKSFKRFLPLLTNQFQNHHLSTDAYLKEQYKEHFQTLDLKQDASFEEVKNAFLNLAKKYHPDSPIEADTIKFQKIENAYRKLQEKFQLEAKLMIENKEAGPSITEENDNEKDYDQHYPLQHRQYLSFEGIGQGTWYQREKQYQKYKVKKAVEHVYNHRVLALQDNKDEASLVIKDTKAAKKSSTKYGIDRLVEDLILESMAKGEFSNLKGSGKPLQHANYNPYVDVVTHKINQVLIDNGFSPQWVMLEKEIRADLTELKTKLRESRSLLGRLPLNPADTVLWRKQLNALADDVKSINKKINDYNLIVPLLSKQMVHVNLEQLSQRCLEQDPSCFDVPRKTSKLKDDAIKSASDSEPGFLGFLTGFWKSSL